MRSDTAILIHIKSLKLYVLHRLYHVLFKRGRNPDVGKITALGRIGDLCSYKQGTEHARVFAEKEFCRCCDKYFISNSEAETAEYTRNVKYPLVSKLPLSSGSQGVRLLKGFREALRICRKVFGNGLSTHWGYVKQKDYAYFRILYRMPALI